MNTQTVSNWMQVGSSVAVVVGIVLLVFELQQQRELAQAQFIIDTNALRMASDIAVLGEDMGEVMARACFHPDSLSESDLVKLDRYFSLRLGGINTIHDAETLADASEPTWPRRLGFELERIWRIEAGRTWWRDQKHRPWGEHIFEVSQEMEEEGYLDDPVECGRGDFYSSVVSEERSS
jgi:hypothetical protein